MLDVETPFFLLNAVHTSRFKEEKDAQRDGGIENIKRINWGFTKPNLL